MDFLKTVASPLRRLLGDKAGNVATIAALVALPLTVMAGVSVDLSRQQSAKSDAQSAVDQAALAVATSRSTAVNRMSEIADDYLAANIDHTHMRRAYRSTVSYDDGVHIKVRLTGSVDSIFAGLVGRNTMPINVEAVAVRGAAEAVEVALVLDNTWSMVESDGSGRTRIDALKSASRLLVNELMAREDAPVRIGVVPYADYVNVGTSNRGQSWLSVPADYSTTSTTPRTCTDIKTETTCTGGVRGVCTQYRDGVPETYSCWTTPQTCRTRNLDPPYKQSCQDARTTTTNYRWYGCVASRRTGRLRLDDSQPSTPYVGFLGTSQACLNPVLPLSSSKSTVLSTINGMIINIGGYKPETHIPSGMIWGVNVLSPTAPFTDGRAYHPNNRNPRKILVLMTDGANTRRFRNSDGMHVGATSTAAYDTEMAQTNRDVSDICDYAKSKNIEVYTVGLNVPTLAGRTMLRDCATSEDRAFRASDSASLEEAFREIAASINSVRLVK